MHVQAGGVRWVNPDMWIHFVGIGGTLMGHLAVLAKELGYRVSGCDRNIYPPMSEVLAAHHVPVEQGPGLETLAGKPDMVVLGNAGLARGHDAVEYLLEHRVAFMSGAQWLGEVVLRGRRVLAVSGTHGKTTTASMLAWILDRAGLQPGFMIGGVPVNFTTSARLGKPPFFVVEADEYDTSYFDRRAKFLHYFPHTLIIGNLEYDHADIYEDLAEIQNHFHLLLRQLPGNGLLIVPHDVEAVNEVIARGCWTRIERCSVGGARPLSVHPDETLWHASSEQDDEQFRVWLDDKPVGAIPWRLPGDFNRSNALAALAAARSAGVSPAAGMAALGCFAGVKRRLETLGSWGNLTLYDDFAHHPTAIASTLKGMRTTVDRKARILALIDPASHTMKRGDLLDRMASCTNDADAAVWLRSDRQKWTPEELMAKVSSNADVRVAEDVDSLVDEAVAWFRRGEPVHVVCMSNGHFDNLQVRIMESLDAGQQGRTRRAPCSTGRRSGAD